VVHLLQACETADVFYEKPVYFCPEKSLPITGKRTKVFYEKPVYFCPEKSLPISGKRTKVSYETCLFPPREVSSQKWKKKEIQMIFAGAVSRVREVSVVEIMC
jgi:hypothetical protein